MMIDSASPIIPSKVFSEGKRRALDNVIYEKQALISFEGGYVKRVWSAKMDGRDVAVIKIEIDPSKNKFKPETILSEVSLRRLMEGSKYFLPILHLFETPCRKKDGKTKIVWIEPLCNKGDLINARLYILNNNLFKELARQLQKGLEEAHSKKLVLADIKPDNILVHVNEKNELQIAYTDLGGSYLEETSPCTPTLTYRYCSPEQIIHERASHKRSTDVYSLAMTLLVIHLGQLETPAKQYIALKKEIKNQEALLKEFNKRNREFVEAIPSIPFAHDLKRMLQFEPELRPSISEVLK